MSLRRSHEGIRVTGPTKACVRGKTLGLYFCVDCGCVAYWRSLQPDDAGKSRVADYWF